MYQGRFAFDRYRTDVSWEDQLAATTKFLRKLAPIARDLGLHLNLETHEEITSFEVVRLVEAVGPDVIGVVFDTANVLQRGEHPTWAAKRLAPYVRQTHIKDAFVGTGGDGLIFQLRPCGEGVVEFSEILPILAKANPGLNLSIENQEYYENNLVSGITMPISTNDPVWHEGHPDLSREEQSAYAAMVEAYAKRIKTEDRKDWQSYQKRPYSFQDAIDYIQTSAAHIRRVCTNIGVRLDGVQ